MRPTVLLMGLCSMLAGLAQIAFSVYLFDVTDHAGSPLRLRGSLGRYVEGHPQRGLIDYQHEVALKVMAGLDTSNDVHLLSGLLFIGMGAVLVLLFFFAPRPAPLPR
ncbi:hypothetical protein [Stenotrophomonas sp.]|uniref:hypothetical protein n=1 Tax=Stenotrophomonas sp. TaxID=69392 RepID=UPI002FC5C8CE